jgi:hypothetical protein
VTDPELLGMCDGEHLLPEPWLHAGELREFARVVAYSVVIGLVAGVVWWLLAARVDLVVTGHSVDFVIVEPTGFMAADAMFFVVVLVGGLLTGTFARWRVRDGGLGIVVGLVLGGFAAAVMTALVGSFLGRADPISAAKHLADGVHLVAALRLRSLVAATGWPIGALIVWVALDARPALHELVHPGGT